jgi:hypothetical protein
MFLGMGSGGGAERQREMPKSFTIEDLKTKEEIRQVLDEIGGENLLKEQEVEYEARKGEWIERVQSEVLDKRGAAVAIKEGGRFVGLVLVTNEGEMKQFRCAEGIQPRDILEQASKKLKDKGIGRITASVSQRAEHARDLFTKQDFQGESKDDRFTFTKSL